MTDNNVEWYGATGEMIARITRAVRSADEHFKDVGGSTRHWVRECLLAALEEEGLEIVEKKPPFRMIKDTGKTEPRINVKGATEERVDPEIVAKALGANGKE
jgi:hypothetical protein